MVCAAPGSGSLWDYLDDAFHIAFPMDLTERRCLAAAEWVGPRLGRVNLIVLGVVLRPSMKSIPASGDFWERRGESRRFLLIRSRPP
jgi:hypothetical protein